jgi:hypothetical protein
MYKSKWKEHSFWRVQPNQLRTFLRRWEVDLGVFVNHLYCVSESLSCISLKICFSLFDVDKLALLSSMYWCHLETYIHYVRIHKFFLLAQILKVWLQRQFEQRSIWFSHRSLSWSVERYFSTMKIIVQINWVTSSIMNCSMTWWYVTMSRSYLEKFMVKLLVLSR